MDGAHDGISQLAKSRDIIVLFTSTRLTANASRNVDEIAVCEASGEFKALFHSISRTRRRACSYFLP